MDFCALGPFYDFECLLIFKFNGLLLGISRQAFLQFAVDLPKMRPQFRKARLQLPRDFVMLIHISALMAAVRRLSVWTALLLPRDA